MATFLLGVNLAGAEFGNNVPGVFGTDYTYPTHTEIDYYASKCLSENILNPVSCL